MLNPLKDSPLWKSTRFNEELWAEARKTSMQEHPEYDKVFALVDRFRNGEIFGSNVKLEFMRDLPGGGIRVRKIYVNSSKSFDWELGKVLFEFSTMGESEIPTPPK